MTNVRLEDLGNATTLDSLPGLVIIRGDLHARTLSSGNGARIFVEGSVLVEDCLFGQHGDLHFRQAVEASRAGRSLFLPGIEERFPQRLSSRRTA